MKDFFPEKVFVEKTAAELPRAHTLLERLAGAEVIFVEDHRKIDFSAESTDERFLHAKKNLVIAVKRGGLVKEFRRHSCLKQSPEYYLIHAANCPFDCSYCYLQSYYENALPTIFVNTDELFVQIEDVLRERPDDEPKAEILFHAGETADALALEHLSGFAADAVRFFADRGNACLELRTKSANVDAILPLSHAGRTVVSWTLTPRRIVAEYERGTAPLEARLEAALQCQRAGYPIGLRLDPVIHYEGWEDGYRSLVEDVSKSLDPTQIHSIVLGGFRFPPRLREIFLARYGRNDLILDEFVPSPDGKLRYFRHIREEMYRKLIRMIHGCFGAKILARVELAMEPEYVWRNVGLSAED